MAQHISTPETHQEEIEILRREYNRVVPVDSYVRTFADPFDAYAAAERDGIARRRIIREGRVNKLLREAGVA